MCAVLHLVKLDPRTKSEVQESYAWDPSRKVSKSLLQKSKAIRFELWSKEDHNLLVGNGWIPALRLDGTEIISGKGYKLYTFPERRTLPAFPY